MRLHALAFIALVVPGIACADAARDVLTEIAKCSEIGDAGERLKCFDSAAARAKSALAATPAAPTESRSVLDWFGFSRPPTPATKPEEFGKASPEPQESKELTQISASVVELARTSRGKTLFFLDNGQLWRQIDADSTDLRDLPSTPGTKVTIEKGFLGSYNLLVAGRNGLVKVNRVH
jgi:hypothetical protein